MAHPLDYFDSVYIINLASRIDRRREMAAQLARIGLSFESHNVRLFRAVKPRESGQFSTVGARGCFMSHLGVLRHAVEHRFQRILILEDDLNFSDDFSARIDGVLHALKSGGWGMFYGGYVLERAVRHAAGEVISLSPDEPVQTAHFVGFHGAAISDAAGYLAAMLERPGGDPAGGPMHVDGAYCWFRRSHPHHVAVLAVPELGYQRASRTDIHELKWFDTVPVVRGGVALLRRLRNRLTAGLARPGLADGAARNGGHR